MTQPPYCRGGSNPGARCEQVFGKTLVCKDLDIATEAGRATDLNCVTIEGDQVGKKGTLTGGFLDIRR